MTGLVGLAVLLGSLVQRLVGLGFTLVAAPLLVIVLGAWDGISIMYLFGTSSCLWAAWQMRRHLSRGRASRLAVAALVGVVPGVLTAVAVSDRVLGVAVGMLTVVACLFLVAAPGGRMTDTPGLQLTAGLGCGALGGLAGSGGPPLVLYGAVAAVETKALVAAMQVTFAVVGVFALMLRWGITGELAPALPPTVWLVAATAVVAGDRLGSMVQPLMPASISRALMLTLALAGSIALVWRSVV
jgi:uncharacterized membrane protein YfcA